MTPHGGKEKHQERKNKNACQTTMSNGLVAIWTKGIHKACWTSTRKNIEYGDMNESVVN